MRRIIFLISLICTCSTGHAQINLVYNPSFEDHWRCPQFIDLVKYANYWTAIEDTTVSLTDTLGFPPYLTDCKPEYCNECSSYYKVSVPSSFFYTQHPHTGSGMMQMIMYYNDEDTTSNQKRDYLQGRLKQQLEVGQQYCVTFYVCLEGSSAYASNHIGAYFDDATLDTSTNCGLVQTMYEPQVYEEAIVTDTLNWTKIQGVFTASDNQKFITIGNFFDAAHTDTIREHFSHATAIINPILAYYLVDDISVISVTAIADAGHDTTILAGDTAWIGNHDDYLPCKWYLATTGALIDSNHAGLAVHPSMTTSYVMELDVCGILSYDTVTVTIVPTETEASPRPSPKEREVLLPNPARDYVGLTPALSKGEGVAILRDMTGKVVLTTIITPTSSIINIERLPSGVYIVEFTDSYGMRSNLRLVKE